MMAAGWPKCGTHALVVMLANAGFKPCGGTVIQRRPGEQPFRKNVGEGNLLRGHVWEWPDPVIVVVRHPRNAWVSMCRHQDRTPSAAEVEALSYNGWNYIDGYAAFVAGWIGSPFVRYEDMDLDTARKTATPTLNAIPSNWREHWNDKIDAAWSRTRGPNIEQFLHYQEMRHGNTTLGHFPRRAVHERH